ncbi:MAG: MltA domain-containing protein, partial [Rhodocyclales bacterium]|nr:MltA domain-containing protein [Rhodocyclales bacterium]
MKISSIFILVACSALLLSSCTTVSPASQASRSATQPDGQVASLTQCPPVPKCAPAQPAELPAAPPMQTARWEDLPGWEEDDPTPAFIAFLDSCRTLSKQALWRPVCLAAQTADVSSPQSVRGWFKSQFQPWAMVNADGSRTGMITGYYEPVLQGSRKPSRQNPYPVHAAPGDLITVDLSKIYPELKHLRLRGRLEGKKLIPYYDRAEWDKQGSKRSHEAIAWVSDAVELFFMQVQGSGQIALPDGSRMRVGYADQNGHPYRSIGRWLIDQGEISIDQASMQGIKNWAENNPKRLNELLNQNPSVVFFRELPPTGPGPLGALGVPLTPTRSLAVDPRYVPLGTPLWLATTMPNSEQALTKLMLAQDTGGAIRGAVRGDFYWGSGEQAGNLAGKMRQSGR